MVISSVCKGIIVALVLGISAFYHDSAAALVENGIILSAAQEERFTRKKHDPRFPVSAISNLLRYHGKELSEVDAVIFYDKPLLKFERLLETYFQFAPHGFKSFSKSMPIWIKEKVFLKDMIRAGLKEVNPLCTKQIELLFSEHHQAHAAASFYPSPFRDAAVLCLDGVGEWATSSAWHGSGEKLTKIWEINFPHSLGLLYSAVTYYCGFKVNSGEYKLMGLAPYGVGKYTKLILDHCIEVLEDGSFALNMEYFDFATGLKMTSHKFERLFGRPARDPESQLESFHMDVAKSIQEVTELVLLRLTSQLKNEIPSENLCLGGGVALNCVANGKLKSTGTYKNIWIQPAAGDAGSALGAALLASFEHFKASRSINSKDSMLGSYIGTPLSQSSVEIDLNQIGARYSIYSENDLLKQVSILLERGAVIGWCQGRMEFGPRALGARSIIADPRSKEMQSKLNLKIKYRESFRPFAPAVLAEHVHEYFEYEGESPYMLMVANVRNDKRLPLPDYFESLFGIEKLNVPRSVIPAVTHIDFSARIQTVHRDTNPKFYDLIKEFYRITGCPIVVNTSFNVRGEPIVCSVEDAYRCFMRTEMDYLVVDNAILKKEDQAAYADQDRWKEEFTLD
jgi:carbamoyltransferase